MLTIAFVPWYLFSVRSPGLPPNTLKPLEQTQPRRLWADITTDDEDPKSCGCWTCFWLVAWLVGLLGGLVDWWVGWWAIGWSDNGIDEWFLPIV